MTSRDEQKQALHEVLRLTDTLPNPGRWRLVEAARIRRAGVDRCVDAEMAAYASYDLHDIDARRWAGSRQQHVREALYEARAAAAKLSQLLTQEVYR